MTSGFSRKRGAAFIVMRAKTGRRSDIDRVSLTIAFGDESA